MVARLKGIERDRLKHSNPGDGLMQRLARESRRGAQLRERRGGERSRGRVGMGFLIQSARTVSGCARDADACDRNGCEDRSSE